MPIYAFGALVPSIHPDAYVHPDATVIGDVTIAAQASVWPQAVLRGDYGHIEVGERMSVQDGTVIHAGPTLPTLLGSGWRRSPPGNRLRSTWKISGATGRSCG